jgi:hypothetical protein
MEQSAFVWNNYGSNPTPNSQAAQELVSFPKRMAIATAYSQGSMLIEATADCVLSLTKLINKTAFTISPWVCVRAILEASALATWLLDTKISAHERVGRSLAFRHEGLVQQSKFARLTDGKIDPEYSKKQIEKLEKEAVELGFQRVIDKYGKKIGVGQQMPSVTQLIADMLDQESSYRLLSALAHMHPWALQAFSFSEVESDIFVFEGIKGALFEKHMELEHVDDLCIISLASFGQSTLTKCGLFGWDAKPLAALINKTMKKIRVL